MSDQNALVLQTLKNLDPNRYLAALYLPKKIRFDIASIWAFDAEIARIADIVTEPITGEIRLQWWKDLIRSGKSAGSGPLADMLIKTISRHELPKEVFHNYLEARIFDLYQDPMPDTGTLEGYLGETASSLYMLAALCAGERRSPELADACGHAGMAYGMAKTITSLPVHRSRGQIYVPLVQLQEFGLDRTTWLENEPDNRHSAALAYFVESAARHQTTSAELVRGLPVATRALFRINLVVKPLLAAATKAGNRAFEVPVDLSPLKRNWIFAKSVFAI